MIAHYQVFDGVSRRAVAAGGILALHVLVGYALLTGLAQRTFHVSASPLVAKFIKEPPLERPVPPPVVIAPTVFVARLNPTLPQVPKIEVPPEESQALSQLLEQEPSPPGVSSMPQSPAEPIRLLGKHRLPNSEDYYPAALKRLGVEGATNVRVCVDENGTREGEPVIERSSGNARLDEGALNVARAGRYARAMQGNTPVPNCYRFRINFQMK